MKRIIPFLFLIPILLILGCTAPPSCPASCNDSNNCTTDYCSEDTNYACVNDIIPDCCGNGICEETNSETFSSCSADCPDCDDDNVCTRDSFVYAAQSCSHVAVPLTPVFEDDMESGMSKWYEMLAEGIWSVGDENGNGVLMGIISAEEELPALLFADELNTFIGNYSFRGRFKLINGSINFLVRFEGFNIGTYIIVVTPQSTALMKPVEGQEGPGIVDGDTVAVARNVWLSFKIVAIGNRILFFIENTKIIDYTDDDNPYLTGMWGMYLTHTAFDFEDYNGASYFDDISVAVVNETHYLC